MHRHESARKEYRNMQVNYPQSPLRLNSRSFKVEIYSCPPLYTWLYTCSSDQLHADLIVSNAAKFILCQR